MDSIIRRRISFFGWVQGVGFRYTACRAAESAGAVGWVRNEWDGSVSMELQGTSAQIASFFGRLPQAWGRFAPQYTIDETEDLPVRDDEGNFRVRF